MKKYSQILELVRDANPLVHQITNYVTVNDCANMTICFGAAPVMSHAPQDVIDLDTAASALVLNIGTLDENQIEGMLAAGETASKRGIPIVLDPVGAGATPYRTQTAERFIDELSVTVVKGNAGEIGVLAGVSAEVRGVDSAGISGDAKEAAQRLARECGVTVVMSGAEDIITDGVRTLGVRNGVPLMGSISGTGCMANACVAAACCVAETVDACASAMAVLGIAGEKAACASSGPGTFKPAFFDAVYALTAEQFEAEAKIIEY
ncbi:MAG: hydroxyethylthiazole kinase [Methanocorpusculum parvum]|nr:hydroxyethylthiazole kinase [Methanocorpusculum parvum]